MHPGLGVLIHSHQFRCVDGLREENLPAGPLESGGQERPQPPASGTAHGPSLMQALHHRNEPPPPLKAAPEYKDCLLTVQHHCLFDGLCALFFLTTRFKATAFYSHVALWILCVLVARTLTQLSQFRCHRCPSDAHVKAAAVFSARDR